MKNLLAILFLLVFSLPALSQQAWKHHAAMGSVPHRIEVDQQGRVWIGTASGLSVFDGNNWEHFSSYRMGLSGKSILAIAFDSQGRTWIGSEQAIAVFDGTVWAVYDTFNSNIPKGDVLTIHEDKQGNIWVGTYGCYNCWDGKIGRFDGQQWTVFDKNDIGLDVGVVTSITTNQQGEKWFATSGSGQILSKGLLKYNDTTWTNYNTSNSGLLSDLIFDIAFDSQNNLWVVGKGGGLQKFDGTNWTIYDTSNSGILENTILEIEFDSNQELWVLCKSNGISHFDGTNWTNYPNGVGGGNGINGQAISLAFDFNNTAWIGQYPFVSINLQTYDGANWTDINRCEIGMCSNEVFSATKDMNGNLWTINNETLNKYDGNNWIRFDSLKGYISSSMVVGSNNHVWIDKGIVYEYDGMNWVKHNIGSNSNIGSAMAVDSQGNIWHSGGSAVEMYDGSNWTSFNNIDGVDVCVDNNNQIWVASFNGIWKYDGINWTNYDIVNSGLISNRVFTIAADATGKIWIGTEKGLNIYDGNTWQNYTTANSGLLYDEIHHITIDKDGMAWMAFHDLQYSDTSKHGVNSFDGNTWRLYNAQNTNYGLSGDNYITDIQVDKNGEIIFSSGLGGISILNKKALSVNDYRIQKTNTSLLYPNPVTNQFHFVTENINQDLFIYNVIGKKVNTQKIKKENTIMDVSSLVPGIYFYQYGNEVGKFVKQ